MDFSSLTSLIEPQKRKKYLFYLSILVGLLAVFLVWNYFFAAKMPVISKPVPPPEIKINFEVLENPDLDKLQLYEVIPPFGGEIGRDNPFVPYYEIKPSRIETKIK